MMLDGNLNFGIPDITNSNTATASTNILDLGSAKKLITAGKPIKIAFKTVITADGGTISIKVDFVGSDAAALNSNNILLGSSGVILNTADGTAIQTGETVERHFFATQQEVAKRYYGLLVTLGGTNPDTVASTSWAYGMVDYQTNMRGAQAAVPAT